MKLNPKQLAASAVLLGVLACAAALPASAAGPVTTPLALTLPKVSFPWDKVTAESIETGSYDAAPLAGTAQQLSPVTTPANAASKNGVTYVSDNPNVVSVDSEGVAQAVGLGTANITATCGGVSCTYTITPQPDASMIATEMDITLASSTIAVGETTSLSLAVLPTSAANYINVSLSSSNEKVATVNNFGKVTGVAPGKATITATDGNVSCTATITVVAANTSTVSSQSISLNTNYVVLKPGATRTLSAKATPASASQSFTYKSGNSSVATVSPSGVITAVGTGSTSITVSNGKATALVTVIVNRSASASSGSDSSNGDDASNGDDDKITLDPTVQTIQDSTDHEVVFAQSEVPVITGDILNSLRTTGKTLCVVGDGYTLQVSGKDVRNTTGELNTSLELQQVEQGLEFVVNDGKTVPCSARIDLDKSDYSRLYLYNETTGKWQYLNSYKDGVITLDTAGRYLLTNENLRFANINWTFFIAGGAVLVVIAVAYIAFKKRYWFW